MRTICQMVVWPLLGCALGSAQIMTTAVGTNWLFPGNGPAINSPLGSSQGVTVDGAGNVYVSDAFNDIVARVTPDGNLTVVAGNGIGGFSGDGGPATHASLYAPTGVALDAAGNLYFCENLNYRVRRVSTDGTIRTIAGNGIQGYGGDNGPALNASIANVHGIVVAPDGSVLFSDWGNNRVRKISTNGIITTFAGNGNGTFAGDGGPATRASLLHPNGLSLDAAGNLWIADQNNGRIRKVAPDGTISTFGPAGGCPTGVAADGNGGVYVGDPCQRYIEHFTANGQIIKVGGNGSGINEPSGDGGPATQASFEEWSIALANDGNLWISGPDYGHLYRISPSGIFSIVAGNGNYLYAPDGTPAVRGFLNGPTGVTFDASGNMVVADQYRNRLLKITPDGLLYTIVGNHRGGNSPDNIPAADTTLDAPSRVKFDSGGNLYIADQNHQRIRKIDPNGLITTVAGDGNAGFSGDGGLATRASLGYPVGMAFDTAGNMFVADGENHRIRKVTPNGIITTFAGTGVAGFSGDGGPASKASFNHPSDLDFDNTGNMYVADDRNHRIRKITPDGTVSTVAGNGFGRFSGDGGPATAASIYYPNDLYVAKDGSIYIADTGNDRIRRVDTRGIITTVAGNGAYGNTGDGGLAPQASLTDVRGVTMDAAGNLFIGDTSNNRVREVLASGAGVSFSAAPAALTFSGTAGGTPPSTQQISLTSAITGLAFSASAGAPWLSVNVTSGSIPTVIQVLADPGKLSAGTYQANITVNAPNAQPPSTTIAVTFNVQAGASQNKLSASVSSLAFSALQGSGVQSVQVQLTNSGAGALAFTATAATTSGGSWLSVGPGGTISPAAPASLTVNATPGSLPPGTYQGTVSISAAGSVVNLPVTFSVSAASAVILVSQTGMSFTAVAQGGIPLPQTFGILNTGRGSMNWTASASTLSGPANWLQIGPTSGTVVQPYLDVSLVSVSVNPNGMSAGEYYGQIQVRAAAANSPQVLTVSLTVLPAGSNPGPVVQPSSLIFTGVAGATPGSQDVMIGNPQAQAKSYKSNSIGSVFTYLPTNASVAPSQPTTLRVFPDFTSATPGQIDHGVITLLFEDGTPRTVSVLTVVAPSGSGNRSEGTGASACASPKLEIQFRSLVAGFAAVVGKPTTVEVQVVDDCGNLVGPGGASGAGVQATMSNGDSPVNLTHIGNGIWSGTWRPVHATSNSVTLVVTAFQVVGSSTRANQVPLTGTVTAGVAPTVTAGGVVHGASFAAGVPIAPGGLITIYGSNLADSSGQAGSLPLPQQLNGAQVMMGNEPLPLLYTSSGQMNVQVPFDIPVNTQFQITVQKDNVLSVPEPLVVATAQPGIFTSNQQGTGQGIILKSDQVTLAQAGTPASIGETIVIYCTGLGPVSPAIAAGTPPPSSPLSSTTSPVTLTIGGQAAQVTFSGLTPGYPGLYQINAIVPSGVTSGNAVQVTVQVAGQTSPPVTMAVK
jgi:uncharacterized protein (TIGR03437 family)